MQNTSDISKFMMCQHGLGE